MLVLEEVSQHEPGPVVAKAAEKNREDTGFPMEQPIEPAEEAAIAADIPVELEPEEEAVTKPAPKPKKQLKTKEALKPKEPKKELIRSVMHGNRI